MMGTLLDSLRVLSAYPIPTTVIQSLALARSLDLTKEATASELQTKEYRLTKADVLVWLSQAPNVSQAGISYNFSDTDRKNFRQQAASLYKECGEASKSIFGYKGSRL